MTNRLIPAITAILLLAACATTPPLPPPAAPEVTTELRLDPRVGAPSAASTASPAFARGINALRAGMLEQADAEFARAATTGDRAAEANLGRAIVAFHRGDLDLSERLMAQATSGGHWTASRILEAEIAQARGRTKDAIAIYEEIQAAEEAAVEAADRAEQLRRSRFDELFQRASSEPAQTAVVTLREALEYVDAEPARLLLAKNLIELDRFDDARRALDQLQIRGARDADEMNSLLAEIDVGKGRFEEAISRLEPLARKDPARFADRLEEIKQRFSEANMPARYHQATASTEVTRSQLATIAYWKIPAVRFARNLAEPPIAVDLGQSTAREEMIRAMALGLFPVDPITRTVGPERVVAPAAFERFASRLIRLRGLPPCAAPFAGDPGAELRNCGVPLPVTEPITGVEATRAIDAVAAILP